MGRKKKVWIPYEFYHVVGRGNRREPLFLFDEDFEAFLYILQQTHEDFPFQLASYCLMTNHYHLQMRSEGVSISKIMALVNKKYANYFNNKYNLTGHVFEKRYFDKIILGPAGMFEVSRYIHMNPVRANIVGRPEDYQWSSYRYYIYPEMKTPPFLDKDYFIKTLFRLKGSHEKPRHPIPLILTVSQILVTSHKYTPII